MKLKDQKIQARRARNAQKVTDDFRARVKFALNAFTEEQKKQMLEMKEVLIAFKEQTKEPIFIAHGFKELITDIKKTSFEDFAKWQVEFEGVAFFDKEWNLIDQRKARIVEVIKEVKVEVPAEVQQFNSDKALTKSKLEKIAKKILHHFKDKNPLVRDGAEEFLNQFLKEI